MLQRFRAGTLRHRRGFGFGLANGFFGAPYYEPADARVIVIQPVAEPVTVVNPVIPVPAVPEPAVLVGYRGCYSQVVNVPGKSGRRGITIVRC